MRDKLILNSIINPREWFDANRSNCRGFAVVVHGLNNNPQALDPLCKSLAAQGYSALRVALSGHYTGSMDLGKASCSKWLNDIEAAWSEAKGRSSGLPVHCVSYSTGALMCMHAVGKGVLSFKRMYLLAPPIVVQPAVKFLPLLFPFSVFGAALPSLAPKDVRLHTWTPLAAYRALFQAIRKLKGKEVGRRLAAVPTTIAVDPRDEFVSMDGLRCWQHDMLLERWRLEAVYSDGQAANFRRHLLISPQRMGERTWNHMLSDITRFLQ